MHDCRHRYKVFPSVFKMLESVENLDNTSHNRAKDKHRKVLSRH